MSRFPTHLSGHALAFLKNLCTGAIVFSAVLAVPADAGIVNWQQEVAKGTRASFSTTNITAPTVVDIGAVGSNREGDATYEFIVQGSFHNIAGSLLGSNTGGQNQAIRFQQYGTSMVGATEYGVYDYSFGIPTIFDTPVVLTFTSFGEFDTTFLYVNGKLLRNYDTGVGFLGMALNLHGEVALGGTLVDGGGFLGADNFNGSILGFAAYNGLPTANEIRKHADAFFALDPIAEPHELPEPASASLFGLALAGLVLARSRVKKQVRSSAFRHVA
ncbi:hypothetical protein [Variovorax sp. HJSM1_2]|uniref:hypothetical protein n=1 Tax=Variovorax sp. HJSM1_2 TaxID=3366263 RepID=UPI003BDECDBC